MHHFHPDHALAHPYDVPSGAESRTSAPLTLENGRPAMTTTTTSPSSPLAEMSKGGTLEAAAFCVSESSTSSASSGSSSRSRGRHSNIADDDNEDPHGRSDLGSLHDLAFDDDATDDRAATQMAHEYVGSTAERLVAAGAASRPDAALTRVAPQGWWRAPCVAPHTALVTGAAGPTTSGTVQGTAVARSSGELVYDHSYFFAPKGDAAGGRQVSPTARPAASEPRSRTPAAPPRRPSEAEASRPLSRQPSPLPPRPHTPAALGGARMTTSRTGVGLPSPLRSADLRITSPGATPITAGRLYSIGNASHFDPASGSGTSVTHLTCGGAAVGHPYLVYDSSTLPHRCPTDSPVAPRQNTATVAAGATSGAGHSGPLVGPDRGPLLCGNSPLPPRAPSEEQRAALHASMAAVWVDAPLSPAALPAAPLNDSLNSSGSHRRRTTPRPNSEPPSPALSTLAASFSSSALERAQSQGNFGPVRRGRSVSLGAIPAGGATTPLRARVDCRGSAATSPTRTPPGSVFLSHDRSRVDVAPRATGSQRGHRAGASSGDKEDGACDGNHELADPSHHPSPPSVMNVTGGAAGENDHSSEANQVVTAGQAMSSATPNTALTPPLREADASLAHAMTTALQEYYTQTTSAVRQLRRELRELKRAYLHADAAVVVPEEVSPRPRVQEAATAAENTHLRMTSPQALVPMPSTSSSSSPLSSVSSSDADEAHLLSPAIQRRSVTVDNVQNNTSQHVAPDSSAGNGAPGDTPPPTARPLLPTLDETTVERLMHAIERARQRALDTLGAAPSLTTTTASTDANITG